MSENHHVIQGIVIPTDWDDWGNATAISIMCKGEVSYDVKRNSLGTALFKLLRREITARGTIHNQTNGKPEIDLVDFQLFNPLILNRLPETGRDEGYV